MRTVLPRSKIEVEFYCTKEYEDKLGGGCDGLCIDDEEVCRYLVIQKKVTQ